MPGGRTTDRGIIALLVVGGLLLAAFGVRAWVLEARAAERRAVERARTQLEAIASDAVARAQLGTVPFLAAWEIVPAPAPDDRLADDLTLAEAEHLARRRRDLPGALALLEGLLPSQGSLRFVAALRAGRLAAEMDDDDKARRYLTLAASAPPSLRDGAVPVRLAALYAHSRRQLRAGDALDVLPVFLNAAAHGKRLLEGEGLGAPDLLVALAEEIPDDASGEGITRLRDAAAHALEGVQLLAAYPHPGVAVAGDSIVVRRKGRIARLPLSALVPDGVQVQVGRGERHPEGFVSHPLPAPLGALRLLRRPDVEGGPGAIVLVGMILGLGIYAMGAFFAIGALRRSRRVAQMQNDFVAAVSHELKTPIASVRAMAELLGDGVADDAGRTRRYANRIEHEMQRLGDTVRNVLDVAQIERTGRLPVTLQAGDPAEVVARVAESFAPLLRRRGFTFEWNAQPATTPVPIDAEALRGVLVNLMDNAAKYSLGERKEIELTGAPCEGGYRISVADRGMGIEPGEARALFQRFHRSSRAGASAVPGVGLGLHVVREVVRAHGGQVSAAPREGGGSVFTAEFSAKESA